ncbi:MAG: phosphatidylglycerol lysyltransferase domain-containing protein [Desulfobacterales bacterium]|nr:phosphatidylglycerol lysyltransferase domain-containing protein [Desulfobacterales bacterium]
MICHSQQPATYDATPMVGNSTDDLQTEPNILKPGKFDLETRSLILDFLGHYPPCSCEYSFVNLFSWQNLYRYSWFFYKNTLVIHDDRSQSLFMPIGEDLEPNELFALSQKSVSSGLSGNIGLVPESYVEIWQDLDHYFTVTSDRDAAEYVYKTEDLIALKGNKLHKKKNLISQFKRRFPDFTVVPMSAEDCRNVMQFERRLLAKMPSVPRSLVEESDAIEMAFSHWDDLGLNGLMLLVQDKIAAFAVFSPLSTDTWDIHFEKADVVFKGAAQMINHETAKFLNGTAQYINREQDLGIPGLRQAKLSYAPHALIEPYFLLPKLDLRSH